MENMLRGEYGEGTRGVGGRRSDEVRESIKLGCREERLEEKGIGIPKRREDRIQSWGRSGVKRGRRLYGE
jgi:hypothetical protein